MNCLNGALSLDCRVQLSVVQERSVPIRLVDLCASKTLTATVHSKSALLVSAAVNVPKKDEVIETVTGEMTAIHV